MATARFEPLAHAAGTAGKSARVSFVGDDHALMCAIEGGGHGAAAALFDRYSELVRRTIARILGPDPQVHDATQEAFVRMLRSAHLLRDPQALSEWALRTAVGTATDYLRRKYRRRWLWFKRKAPVEAGGTALDTYGREVVRAVYAVLDCLPPEERVLLALRFIDGMELRQAAAVCSCSHATADRRLERAEARFRRLTHKHPVLVDWIDSVAESQGDEKGWSQ
jgi:RNA polymerase sigma-70 factor (ECF subfamily)